MNCAGRAVVRPLLECTDDDLDDSFAINIKASWHAVRAAAPFMADRGAGTIVNIASLHALAGRSPYSIYAATKGAVAGLTRELAIELAPLQIRVNALLPGFIEVARNLDDPDYDPVEKARCIPAGRVGLPADVARLVGFLAGPHSDYVSGQLIAVDGGLSALMALPPKQVPVTRAVHQEPGSGSH